MSQENVEIVRRGFDAFNRSDVADVAELWQEDAVFRPLFLGGGAVEGAVYRGHAELSRFIEQQSETWATVASEAQELRDLGQQVLVRTQLSAVGRASGVEVKQISWGLYRLRDGKIAEATIYADEAQALESVGLRE